MLKGFTPTKIKTTQPIRIRCEASELSGKKVSLSHILRANGVDCSTNAYNFSYLNDINMKFPQIVCKHNGVLFDNYIQTFVNFGTL